MTPEHRMVTLELKHAIATIERVWLIARNSELEAAQIKQARRAAKEAALAAKQSALPDKRYGVIVADPAWRWEPYSRETGMDRAADNHYPTSGVEAIAALPVSNIAAEAPPHMWVASFLVQVSWVRRVDRRWRVRAE